MFPALENTDLEHFYHCRVLLDSVASAHAALYNALHSLVQTLAKEPFFTLEQKRTVKGKRQKIQVPKYKLARNLK